MNPAQSTAPNRREAAVAATALAAVVGVVVFLNGTASGLLFTRPFWIDEMHTVLVAERGSPLDVIRDLAAGADFGPPLLPLAAWALRHLLGSLGPLALRVAAFLCVLAAVAVVYVVLRRRFSPDASLAGAAALGVHPLVMEHAFEGRYYGPWLLCAALFAWSLGSGADGRAGRFRLGATSVLLCTVHWYGVIALVLMSAAAVLVSGAEWRRALARISPAAAGIAALAACVPLALGQRGALTVNTWVADFRPSQLGALGGAFWTSQVPAACAAVIAIVFAVRLRRRLPTDVVLRPAADESVAALLSLVAMPIALAALSAIGQPSMIGRYAILTLLAWAPLAALAADAAGRWPARLLAVWLLALTTRTALREVNRKVVWTVGVRADATAFATARSFGLPVVFQSMHTLYAVAGVDPANRGAMLFLDLPDSTLNAMFPADSRFYQLNKGIRVERDVVRVHARRFGFPKPVTQGVLDTTSRFVLIVNEGGLPRGWFRVDSLGAALFPGHRAVPVGGSVTLFERVSEAGKVPSRSQNAPIRRPVDGTKRRP